MLKNKNQRKKDFSFAVAMKSMTKNMKLKIFKKEELEKREILRVMLVFQTRPQKDKKNRFNFTKVPVNQKICLVSVMLLSMIINIQSLRIITSKGVHDYFHKEYY